MAVKSVPVTDRGLLNCRGRILDLRLGERITPVVMGILNVTPDSFADGGRYADPDLALRRADLMVTEGATVIDVGGESTRPAGASYGRGAIAVDAREERRRVVPVIRRIRAEIPDAIVSVDTYKSSVADAALEAGVHIINDVSGLRRSDESARLAASAGAPMIVMHAIGLPGAMPQEHHYTDVVAEVKQSLAESIARAESAGVRDIVVDPGFGFGKTVRENLRLVRHVADFTELGCPVLLGVSRKSSIGAVLGSEAEPVPVAERLFGSLGAAAFAALSGVSMIRTHDVGPTVQLLRVIAGIASA